MQPLTALRALHSGAFEKGPDMAAQQSQDGPTPHDYLSPAEVAKRTPFTVKALEVKRHKGEGPKWHACGRRIVYKWSDIVAWIEGESA